MTDSSVEMRTLRLSVRNGLHLKPISVLVQHVRQFQSAVTLTYGDKTADLRSVLDLMGLGARNGSMLKLEARGDDARLAADSIEALFASGALETDDSH